MFKRITRNIFNIKELIKGVIEHIDLRYKNKAGPLVTGIPSGFKELDRMTTGFRNGTLTIVAGRPSMGKTAFVLSIVQHLVLVEKIPILFFSLEMTKEELVQRMLCAQARVVPHKVRTGDLETSEWPRLTAAAGMLSGVDIHIDDTEAIIIDELGAKARRLKAKQGIKLIVIDYLQLTYGLDNLESRQDTGSEICRSLKALAEDLQIPILVTSQLSRRTESRKGHRPQLSDLRELGAIERDADTVILLFREEYYHPVSENYGRAEIIVAKNRVGPVGTVYLKFQKSYMRFEDIQTMGNS